MALHTAFSKRLYLRIWLAVVLGVAVLMLLVGWFWRLAEQHNSFHSAAREVIVRNAAGEVIGTSPALAQRGRGVEFELQLPNGEALQILGLTWTARVCMAEIICRTIQRLGGRAHLMGFYGCWPWWAWAPHWLFTRYCGA